MSKKKKVTPLRSAGKRPAERPSKTVRSAPRTAKQYSSLSARAQEIWHRVTQAISKMRTSNISLEQASRQFEVDPRTVARHGAVALGKSPGGRYVAKPHDALLRPLVVPTHEGTREILVRGSRRASQLGEFWAAVQKYLQTGDASEIKKFRGRNIRAANGERIFLITDRDELNRLGSAGVLSFESLYARST